MGRSSIQQTFTAALDALVAQIKDDRSILAAILCGSLSHDTVWAKSDIDLALVTIDDKKADRQSLSINADGVNVHAFLVQRTEFRQLVEGSLANSFMHSLLTKGRLLYAHDQTVADLFARLSEMGERDRSIQLLRAATNALPSLYKARKWFVTRADLDYTALWILYAATSLAQIEVMTHKQLVDREVIPQAMRLNPEFFRIVYTNMLNGKKTKPSVESALMAAESFIAGRSSNLFALVLDHLRDAGEARSCTEIEHHFARHFDIGNVTTACEYLADQGIITKAALPARLTKRSNVDVQEMAFFL